MTKKNELYVVTLTKKLANYVMDILEDLYLANNLSLCEERINHQQQAKIKLGTLDYFAQIAYEQQCILYKQYEQISKIQAESLLHLNKWIASDMKRISIGKSN